MIDDVVSADALIQTSVSDCNDVGRNAALFTNCHKEGYLLRRASNWVISAENQIFRVFPDTSYKKVSADKDLIVPRKAFWIKSCLSAFTLDVMNRILHIMFISVLG